jgi:periplasmic divalent cation tolerance protein
MDKISIVYITVATLEEARSLAKSIIEAKLAACVNYWQNLASVYWWEGELCEEQEVVMFVKTTADKFGALKEFVESLHSYTLPCILQLEVSAANPAYADWVQRNISPEPSPRSRP